MENEEKNPEPKAKKAFGKDVIWVAVIAAVLLGAVYLSYRNLNQPPLPVVPVGTPEDNRTFEVHVVGAVHQPGIVMCRPGERVRTAIDLAGGATDAADLDQVNLAKLVTDGMQIRVPEKTIAPEKKPASTAKDSAPVFDEQRVLFDLNTVTVEELQLIPGVGPALAQRIVEYRNRSGGFRSLEELLAVEGIGQGNYRKIAEYLYL
ncbi:MAG: helix-hairpin-helix domain-containing protein [Fimbriimonadaceae bacterium]